MHATKNLGKEQKNSSDPRKSTNQAHSKGDCWVKETSTDSEENPSVDSQGETEAEGNVLQLLRIAASLCERHAARRVYAVGNLSARQCKEEEEYRSDKFTAHGNEMVS